MRYLLLFSAIFFVFGVSAKPVVTLSTHNIPPYGSFIQGHVAPFANADFRGAAVDVVRCAFDKVNRELVIHVVPWKRAQFMAMEGNVDGFFAASQKNSRDEFAVMSEIVAEQIWTWYLLRNTALAPSSPDFKSKARVSSFDGANMHKWLQENNYKTSIPPSSTDSLLRMLLAKRFDAVLANNLVMQDVLQKRQLFNKVDSYPSLNKPLGVYFTKKYLASNPGFLTQFNQAVLDCRGGG